MPELSPNRLAEPRSGWADALLPLGLIAGLVVLLSLDVSEGEPALESFLEGWLRTAVEYAALATEAIAVAVVVVAVVRGAVQFVGRMAGRSAGLIDATEGVRLQLGRVLALALEFTVASDILRLAVAPSKQDVVILGAVVLLRTLLNFFLEREIREGKARRETTGEPTMSD